MATIFQNSLGCGVCIYLDESFSRIHTDEDLSDTSQSIY